MWPPCGCGFSFLTCLDLLPPDRIYCLKLRLAEAKLIMCTCIASGGQEKHEHARKLHYDRSDRRTSNVEEVLKKEFKCPKYRRTKQGPYTALILSFGFHPPNLDAHPDTWQSTPRLIVCRNPNAPIVGHKKQMDECIAREQVRAGITTLLELWRSKRLRKPL